MKKIMLVVEDYSENNRLGTILKKIGFDVLSMNVSTGLVEKLLGFNPDIVVSFGHQKFTSLSIGQKLKEMHHVKAKSLIVLPLGERPNPTEIMKARMDVLMEAPIIPQKFIEVISRLASLDPLPLIDKLRKAQLTDPTSGMIHNRVGEVAPGREKLDDPTRTKKYDQFVATLPPINKTSTTFVKNELKERQAEMEKSFDPVLTESINELKKQFVEAMFKKK